jgi:hypothetical protein
VCGGWLFAKSLSICVHGQHEVSWKMTSEGGLQEDRSLRVDQNCDQEYAPRWEALQASATVPRPVGADSLFRPFHDYIDRTQYGLAPNQPTKPPVSVQLCLQW